MYLSGMELYGFKSFSARTLISFDKEFNVIVGPNGCGKSNIVDAVRWVLGDQSAKSLRLPNMDSVIFNGTQELAPLNVAEVTLFFKEIDEQLSGTFSEISITRRLFRGSTSEYFFNKKSVLLKELKEINAKLGITSIAYSVISQGRVDKILESNPDERRLFLEEAAGIAVYLARRQDALSKLERTQENLEKILPTLRDKNKRLKELETQAIAAKEYRGLLQGEKDLQICLALKQHSQFIQKQQAVVDRITEKQSKIDTLNKKIETHNKEHETIQQSLTDYKIKEREIEHEQLTLNSSSETQQELIASLERQLIDQVEQRAIQEQVSKSYQESIKKIEQEMTSLQSSQTDEIKLQQEQEKIAQDLQTQIDSSKELQKQNKKSIETQSSTIEKLANRISQKQETLKDALEALAREVDATLGMHSGVVNDLKNTHDEFEKIFAKARVLCADLSSNTKNTAAKDTRLAELSETLEKVEELRVGHIAQLYQCISSLIRDTGPLALKRSLDTDLEELMKELSTCEKQRKEHQVENQDLEEKEKLLVREYHQREYEKLKSKQNMQFVANKIQDLKRQLNDTQEQYKVHKEGVGHAEERGVQIKHEKLEREALLKDYKKTRLSLERELSTIKKHISNFEKKHFSATESYNSLISKKTLLVEESNRLKLSEHEHKTKIEILIKDFYTNHAVHLLSQKTYLTNKIYVQHTPNQLEAKLMEIKQTIKAFGKVNLLAEEEHVSLEEECNSLQHNLDDIETARKDLFNLLERINDESRKILNQTLEEVNIKFAELFKLVFQGGTARLFFVGSDDPLKAGLEIEASPSKKKTKNLFMLSGGERTLLAISLLFALHSIKPAPVVLFDELDAPLDDQNIDRFLQLLYTFKSNCQFVLVSHNKKTISQGRKIIGITMQESGVSSLLEVDVSQ